MLWKLGASLVRAKSLVSIHLSGNQGITPALKKHIRGRIRCKELPEDFKIIIQVEGSSPKFASSKQVNLALNQEKYFRENMQLRKNKNAIIKNDLNTIQDDRKLIFERQLGHKSDLPGSA